MGNARRPPHPHALNYAMVGVTARSVEIRVAGGPGPGIPTEPVGTLLWVLNWLQRVFLPCGPTVGVAHDHDVVLNRVTTAMKTRPGSEPDGLLT